MTMATRRGSTLAITLWTKVEFVFVVWKVLFSASHFPHNENVDNVHVDITHNDLIGHNLKVMKY